ncbi:CHRD domain-containing protein [Rhodohalobacter mucosus]|nr:CHRD domain-containing protein [Rhodohalobacter mucosus]
MRSVFKSALVSLFGLCAILIIPYQAEAQISAEFDLAGYHVTEPVGTAAVGMAEATVRRDSLIISGHFEDLKGRYWSAYIHYGAPGEKGNRLLKLHADVSDDHRSGRFDPQKNAFKMSDAVREALSEGNLYLLVSSEPHRQGEIRGQLPEL